MRTLCVCRECGADFHRYLSPSRIKKGEGQFCSRTCASHTRNSTHRLSRTPTYASWRAMRCRCTLETDPSFYRYGAKGVSICTEWDSFEQFLADMGKRPKGTSLDRIDNDGNYEPSNCRWATPKEQIDNRSNSLFFEGMPLTDACIKYGISYKTVTYRRMKKGWSIEKAVKTPVNQSYSRH